MLETTHAGSNPAGGTNMDKPYFTINQQRIEFDSEKEKEDFLEEFADWLHEHKYFVSSISYDLCDTDEPFTEDITMIGNNHHWTE